MHSRNRFYIRSAWASPEKLRIWHSPSSRTTTSMANVSASTAASACSRAELPPAARPSGEADLNTLNLGGNVRRVPDSRTNGARDSSDGDRDHSPPLHNRGPQRRRLTRMQSAPIKLRLE